MEHARHSGAAADARNAALPCPFRVLDETEQPDAAADADQLAILFAVAILREQTLRLVADNAASRVSRGSFRRARCLRLVRAAAGRRWRLHVRVYDRMMAKQQTME